MVVFNMMLVDVDTENCRKYAQQNRETPCAIHCTTVQCDACVCQMRVLLYAISLYRLCFEMSSARWCHSCDESILIAEKTSEFKIKYCSECFECSEVLSLTVSWYNEYGDHGEATQNSDNTYTVQLYRIYHTCRMIANYIFSYTIRMYTLCPTAIILQGRSQNFCNGGAQTAIQRAKGAENICHAYF